MNWLDKHMPEGKRIRNELNSNVLTFRRKLTAPEVVMEYILNQFASIGVSYPKNMTLDEFRSWLNAPETQWVVEVAIHKLNGGKDVLFN